MDKLVINDFSKAGNITISKDCNIFLTKEVKNSNIELMVKDCKVTIIDDSNASNKKIKFENSIGTIVDISNKTIKKKIKLINDNSDVEYNIIDLLDNDVECCLEEEIVSSGAKTEINVASICYKNKNKNYVINTSNLEKNSINNINCFGIVKDDSKLNYDITSFIKNGASKSIVSQNSSILLFDEVSVGKSNPILVIEENDVKANHGSSIGKIDDETMFYLCSRGLSKSEATNLICLGKVQHLIDKIDDESIKEMLINTFKERMN